MKKTSPHNKSQSINYVNCNLLEILKSSIENVTAKPAQRSGKGYRLQCPAHGGNDRNLYIADGDKRLIVCCHSHHCDPKDIFESVGLSIKDIYYDQLTPKQQQANKFAKSDAQVEAECLHAYHVIIQLPTMKKNGIKPDIGDAISIRKALAVLDEYNFTEADCIAIEEKQQNEADERRLIACERALDDSYDKFLGDWQ
jgi:hypothetical protein